MKNSFSLHLPLFLIPTKAVADFA